jgi:hypothetical protein
VRADHVGCGAVQAAVSVAVDVQGGRCVCSRQHRWHAARTILCAPLSRRRQPGAPLRHPPPLTPRSYIHTYTGSSSLTWAARAWQLETSAASVAQAFRALAVRDVGTIVQTMDLAS